MMEHYLSTISLAMFSNHQQIGLFSVAEHLFDGVNKLDL